MTARVNVSWIIQLSRIVIILGTCYLFSACSSQETASPSQSLTRQQLIDDLNTKQNLWLESGAADYSFSIHKECDCPEFVIPAENVNVVVQNNETSQLKTNNKHDQTNRTKQSFFNSPENMEQYFSELRQAILLGKIHNVTYNSQYGFPSSITIRPITAQDSPYNQSPDLRIHTRNFRMSRTEKVAELVSLTGTLASGAAHSDYWLVADNGQWYELKINPVLLGAVTNIAYGTRVQVHGVIQYTGDDAQTLIDVSQFIPDYTQTSFLTLSGSLALSISPGGNDYNYQLIENSGNAIELDLPDTLQTNIINLNSRKITITGQWNLTQTRFVVSQVDASSYTPIEKVGRLRLSPSIIPNSPNQFLFVESNGQANVIRFPETLRNEAHRLHSSQAQVRVSGFLAQRLNEVYIEAQQITELANTLFNVQATGLIIEQGISFPGSVNRMFKLQTDAGTAVYIELDPAKFQLSDSITIGARIQIAGEWLQNSYNGQFYISVNLLNIISMSQSPSENLSGYIIHAGTYGKLLNCSNLVTYNNLINYYKLLDDNGRVIDLHLDNTTQIIGATTTGNNFRIGDRVTAGVFQQNNTTYLVKTLQILSSSSIPYENHRAIAGTINAIYDSCIPPAKIAILQTDNNQLINLALPANVNSIYSGPLEYGKRAQISGLFSTDNSSALVAEMTVLSHQPQQSIQGTIRDVQAQSNNIKLLQLSLEDGRSFEIVVYIPGTVIEDNLSLTPGTIIRVVGADLPTGLPRFVAHQIYLADSGLPSDPGSNTSITSMQLINTNVEITISHPEGLYIGAQGWILRIGTESFPGDMPGGDPTMLVVNVPTITLDAIPNGSSMSLNYGPSAGSRSINLGALNKNLITQPVSNTRIEAMQLIDNNVQITISRSEGFYVGAQIWWLTIGNEEFILYEYVNGSINTMRVRIPKNKMDAIPNGASMSLSYGPSGPQSILLGVLNKNLITQPGVDHTQITGSCASCHLFFRIEEQYPNHIQTTNVCEACHSVSSWVPVISVDHTQVIGSCESCHTGSPIFPDKPFNHIISTNACGACHSTISWVPAIVVNHSQVIGTCTSCHNDGPIFPAKPFDHIPSSNQCEECHSTTSWANLSIR